MRRSSIFWGTLIVLFGTLLLLNTTGIIDFDVWTAFVALVLITVGGSILLGPKLFKQKFEPEEISIPLENASQARIEIQHGAGRLKISGGASGPELLHGMITSGSRKSIHRSGDRLDVEIQAPSLRLPGWETHEAFNWKINCNQEIPLNFELHTGASESSYDLSDLQIKNFSLKTGASSTNITMPAKCSDTKATIEAGAASVSVRIPQGVAARIGVEGGLMDIDIDKTRFPRRENWYESPDYENSDNKAKIIFKGGVGSIKVL